jgi:hypothetical protein
MVGHWEFHRVFNLFIHEEVGYVSIGALTLITSRISLANSTRGGMDGSPVQGC